MKVKYDTEYIVETGSYTDEEGSIPMEIKSELIRCKDCKYIIDREDGTHGCYIYLGYDAKVDGFCSHGKKAK